MDKRSFISIWKSKAEDAYARNFHPDLKNVRIDDIPQSQKQRLYEVFDDVASAFRNADSVSAMADFRPTLEQKLLAYSEDEDKFTTPVFTGFKAAINSLRTPERA